MTAGTRLVVTGTEVRGCAESEGLLIHPLVTGTRSLFVVLLAVKVSEFVVVTRLSERQLWAGAIQRVGRLFGCLPCRLMEINGQWSVRM